MKRVGLFIMGVALGSPALASLEQGLFFCQTYWGGRAFLPYCLVGGGFAIFMATFGWRRLEEPTEYRKNEIVSKFGHSHV
jgi:hypothetical protein